MKGLKITFASVCIMLLAMQAGYSQTTVHSVKQHTKHRVHKHRVYESRAAMQLRQAQLHERQAEEVDRVEKKLKRDTSGHR